MSISRELSKFIEPGGQLEYDNTTSGLSATTIKSAIDELNTLLGGGNVGSQATFDIYEFTATASQTTFSLSSNHGQGSDITAGNFVDGTTYIITSVGTTDFVTLYGASSNTVGVTFTANTNPGTGDGTAKVVADYIPGFIKVYLNGVLLSETDYVASDGDNVVLDVGADVGALLSVVVLDSFNTATQLRVLGIDAGAPDNSVNVDASGNLDVTGTVTADGLTVDGVAYFNANNINYTGSSPKINFFENDTTDKNTRIESSGSLFAVKTLTDDAATTTKRFEINHTTGDISFYDTSANQGLFWDASAASLQLKSGSLLELERPDGLISTKIFMQAAASGGLAFDNLNGDGFEFKYAGVDQLVIDSSGNVGIGTTPAAGNTLDISSGDGTIRVTQELDVVTAGLNLIGASNQGTLGRITIWQNATSSQGGYIKFDTCPTGTNTLTEAMRIDSAGNVGINRTSISQPSSGATTLAIQGTDNNKAGAIRLYSANDSVEAYIYPDSINGLSINTSTSHPIVFRTAAVERMRIDSSGNLTLSTSKNAQNTLLIQNDDTTTTDYGTQSYLKLSVGGDIVGGLKTTQKNLTGLSTKALYLATEGNYPIAFGLNASPTPSMVLDTSGNLLVGRTTSTASTFDIEASGSASSGAKFGFLSMGNSATGYPYVGYNCAPTTTVETYERYATDFASWIDFKTGQVRTFTTTTQATGNTTGTAGPYVAGGGTSWTSSSDQRFKDNVQAITYGLDAVKSLNPVSYVRNDRDTGETELGFIAQEVENVVQEVVNVDSDGYYGMNYERLIPVLTKAIQEQQDLIESLTARIAALESN